MELPVPVIIGAALPVFLLLGLGIILRRTHVLTSAADGTLMKLVVRVFYPCLFLDFIIGNPAVKEAPNLIAAPLVGFATIFGGFVMAYVAGRAIGLIQGSGLRSFAFCNGIYNYGYIPIPLIMVLFDDRRTLGVLLVHNVGVEVAIWTVGILILVGRFEWAAVKRIFNPPVMALAAALCINAMGWDAHIPAWMSRFFQMLGACTIPFGILLAGTGIADLLSRDRTGSPVKVSLAAVALRLGIIPATFVVLAAVLPFLSPELRQVMVVQAAMPAGIFPIVLVRHYGGDSPTAVRVLLATTLMSVITMPFWIRFGSSVVLGG
jgi:predicted permease